MFATIPVVCIPTLGDPIWGAIQSHYLAIQPDSAGVADSHRHTIVRARSPVWQSNRRVSGGTGYRCAPQGRTVLCLILLCRFGDTDRWIPRGLFGVDTKLFRIRTVEVSKEERVRVFARYSEQRIP